MHLEVLRLSTTRNTTIGVFYINGKFQCYTIEDTRRFKKVPGDTRIPTGVYEIKLRDEGGMHKRYWNRFPEMHRGMLWLIGVPGFKWVYIHIGNNKDDTEGCILVGDDPNNNVVEDGFVSQSTAAYKRIYPGIRSAIVNGEPVTISVKDIG
jgi:hypothetical protein